MAEEVPGQPETVTIPQPQNENCLLKYVLLTILGLFLLGGTTYAGYWYGVKNANVKTQSSKPQLKTENLIPTETPLLTPTLDPTADWKTYTNKNLRYTIEHPREFKIDELTGVVAFYREKIEKPLGSPIDPYIGGFSIYDRSASGKSAKEACDVEQCQNLIYGGSEWSAEEIRINNSVGVAVMSTLRPLWADYYLASTDGPRVVRIVGGAWSRDPNPTQEQLQNDFRLLQSILSTFQFLD